MAVDESKHRARPAPIAAAVAFSAATLGVGYWALGLATMLIFTAGFIGGLLLWLVWPSGGLGRHPSAVLDHVVVVRDSPR